MAGRDPEDVEKDKIEKQELVSICDAGQD